MFKKVVCILPHGETKIIDVDLDKTDVTFKGDNGSWLTMPIETFFNDNDGNEYLIARYSATVGNEEIISAIKKHFP